MKDWAALTPEQRQQARERYKNLKKLSPQQRREMSRQWQDYRKSLAQPETQFDPVVGDPLPSAGAAAER